MLRRWETESVYNAEIVRLIARWMLFTRYYLLDGNRVTSTGITLGVTLPIVNNYNGLTLGVDFGQRGAVSDKMVRERYINFSIGFNLFDIWFRKVQYQ